MQCAWGWGNRKEKRKEKEKKEGKERASLTGKGEGCHPQGSGNSGAHLSAPLLSQKSGPKQTHLLFEDTWSHLGPQPQHAGGKGTEGSLMQWGGGGARRGHGPGTQGALETGQGYGTGYRHLAQCPFTFLQPWGGAVLQKENSQSQAPAPALQTPVRGEEMLPDIWDTNNFLPHSRSYWRVWGQAAEKSCGVPESRVPLLV